MHYLHYRSIFLNIYFVSTSMTDNGLEAEAMTVGENVALSCRDLEEKEIINELHFSVVFSSGYLMPRLEET